MRSGTRTAQRGFNVFIPNLPCLLRKPGKPDVYGYSAAGAATPERCAVVKIKPESIRTTLRADSGATRGHADEFIISNLVLLAKTTNAALDDQLEVIGYKIRIKMLHPRFNILGELDHYEVEGETWA
jgi:hypothetical protein